MATIIKVIKGAGTMPVSVARTVYADRLLQRGVDYTHEQIMLYMLANPSATLEEIGAHFGYTGVYISQLKSSDAWKARFAELQGTVCGGALQDISKKMEALGDLVTEKLSQKVQESDDPNFIKDSFDKVMHRLGYAPNTSKAPAAPSMQQNNVFVLGSNDLEEARKAMRGAQQDASQLLEEKHRELVEYKPERPAVTSDREEDATEVPPTTS